MYNIFAGYEIRAGHTAVGRGACLVSFQLIPAITINILSSTLHKLIFVIADREGRQHESFRHSYTCQTGL